MELYLLTFTEEIVNGKIHFLYSDTCVLEHFMKKIGKQRP